MIFFLFLPIHLYRFSRCFHFVVMPREARIIKCLVTVTLPRMKPRPVRYPLRCLPEFVCGQIKPANPWLSRVIRNLPLLPKKNPHLRASATYATVFFALFVWTFLNCVFFLCGARAACLCTALVDAGGEDEAKIVLCMIDQIFEERRE